jgi:hypothetical protein
LGIGGGIITKKLLFAALLIFGLSLAGIAGASAAEVGNAQTQSDNNSTVQKKANIQTNDTNIVNKSATTQNSVDENEKTVENTGTATASTSTDQTTVKKQAVAEDAASTGTRKTTVTPTSTSTNVTKQNSASTGTDTQKTVETADVNTQNSVTSSKTANNATSTQKEEATAGETKTTSTNQTANQTANSTSFTVNQINDAAARVKAYIETNHKLPNYVTIGTAQVKMPDFLKLLTAGLLQINNGTTAPVTLETVNIPAKPTESIKSGSITKTGYLDLAKRVNAFINANGILPNYATTTLGKLRYESLIYKFSKILNFEKTNNRLPNYATVKAWSIVSNANLTQARVIYITSDNINSVTRDTARIKAIIDGLKALGLTAVNGGLGPNTHMSVLKNSKVPSNALVVNIYGGACAGTIYEMGLSYYKKLVGAKKVFSVWIPPSANITGLAWLPRAHDDNFSPSRFKGLAHPDQYLKNNGYDYIYSRDLNAIIAAIYKQATTA